MPVAAAATSSAAGAMPTTSRAPSSVGATAATSSTSVVPEEDPKTAKLKVRDRSPDYLISHHTCFRSLGVGVVVLVLLL